jgi:hypothetical protein
MQKKFGSFDFGSPSANVIKDTHRLNIAKTILFLHRLDIGHWHGIHKLTYELLAMMLKYKVPHCKTDHTI